MRIQLLGPVQAFTSDDTAVPLGGVRLRMLLARLAVVPGETVPTATLIDELWGAEVPAQATNALQALVSRLRKALGDAGAVESAPGGYRLAVTAADVDSHRFEALAVRGRRELAAGQHAEAAANLGTALALWQATALADVRDAPFARPTAVRLTDLRLTATEDHAEAKLRLGHHGELLTDLEAATAEHPLRERLAALRMRALHAAGRQAEALAVFASIREQLAERLGVDPGVELRDAHLAVLRGEAETRPARAPAVGRLPLRLTSFVGRGTELDRVAELLAARRLVTVVGMGGTGKTRLAVEAVDRHRAHVTGRVWFTALAAVGSAEDVPDAVASSLDSPAVDRGVTLRPARSTDPVDRIVELLAGDESLLVLDNCEHLVTACAELAHRLLDRLPGLTILATSREPLGITGEALCPLSPLPVPDADTGTEAADTAAVRLFTDRAVAVRPGFAVTESNIDQVAEICRRLDGLPLALELAAARLRAMSLEQIAKRLDDRFRLLTSGSRVALPRQRTLQAVIEWSWDLLSEAERTLARRLSLFVGGASLTAVEAVCGADEPGGEDPVYVLGSLVEKSIVDAVGDAEPRYRMLESVRSFAAERLDAAAEREAVTVRFRHHFLAVAEEQEQLLRTRDQLTAMAVLDAEHANLVAALRSAIDSGDAETAHRLLSAVLYHWSVFGAESRVDAFIAQVLRFAEDLPAEARAAFGLFHLFGQPNAATVDDHSVREAIQECLRTDATRRYPMMLLVATTAAWTNGLDDLWEPLLRKGSDSVDPWVRAGVSWLESYIRGDRGDWDGAQAARAKALREFTEIGDRLGLSSVLADCGKAASVTGDHVAAAELLRRGVEVASERGWEDEIDYRTTLALELQRGGDTEAAWEAIDTALRRARQGGHRQGEMQVLHGYAELHRLTGDLDSADKSLDALTALTTRLSLSLEFADILSARTRMALLLDRDSAAARERFPAVLTAARALLDLPSAAELLARLLAAEDEPFAAARALGWSQVIRGVFDVGDREVAQLARRLRHRLGEAEYDRAFTAGAATPREEALKLLDAAAT